MSSKREQFFMYDCPELGVARTPGNQLGPHIFRYLRAITYAMEIPDGKRGVLFDYGCGSGYGTEMMGSMFEKSYGYDPEQIAILYARKMHDRSNTYFNWVRADHDIAIDFAMMLDVIEHMTPQDAHEAVGWIADRLAPEGMLCLSTPVARTRDGSNPSNPYHLHEYQPGELWEMLRNHFTYSTLRVVGGNIIGCVKK